MRPVQVPLYDQVRQDIAERIASGAWAAGELLPSEMELARTFGVSQGTVRKALDGLSARGIVQRRQGKGTFVAAFTPESVLFHFFRFVRDNGDRATPKSQVRSCRRERPNRDEVTALQLGRDARVVKIHRVRLLDGRPAINEWITVPLALFPALGASTADSLPNTLYQHYEGKFGVSVHRAHETLRAVSASSEDAAVLAIAVGEPILEVTRMAYGLNGNPIERRISRCDTTAHAYASELT